MGSILLLPLKKQMMGRYIILKNNLVSLIISGVVVGEVFDLPLLHIIYKMGREG